MAVSGFRHSGIVWKLWKTEAWFWYLCDYEPGLRFNSVDLGASLVAPLSAQYIKLIGSLFVKFIYKLHEQWRWVGQKIASRILPCKRQVIPHWLCSTTVNSLQ